MEGGMNHGVTLEVRMTGDGSAIMHILGKDTPMEMLTVFHADGPELLATHYCAAHNQPRMQMIPTTGLNRIEFRFKDGTNIGADDGHMVGLIVTFIDADHHDETWIYQDKARNSREQSSTIRARNKRLALPESPPDSCVVRWPASNNQ
jgi:hypothetical protein